MDHSLAPGQSPYLAGSLPIWRTYRTPEPVRLPGALAGPSGPLLCPACGEAREAPFMPVRQGKNGMLRWFGLSLGSRPGAVGSARLCRAGSLRPVRVGGFKETHYFDLWRPGTVYPTLGLRRPPKRGFLPHAPVRANYYTAKNNDGKDRKFCCHSPLYPWARRSLYLVQQSSHVPNLILPSFFSVYVSSYQSQARAIGKLDCALRVRRGDSATVFTCSVAS